MPSSRRAFPALAALVSVVMVFAGVVVGSADDVSATELSSELTAHDVAGLVVPSEGADHTRPVPDAAALEARPDQAAVQQGAQAAVAAVPGNDKFANAATVVSVPFSISNAPYFGATLEVGEPTECRTTDPDGSSYFTPVTDSIWYKYTSPLRQTLHFTARVGDKPWVVNAYAAAPLSQLHRLGCDEEEFGDTNAIQALAGGTYYFQVGVGTNVYSEQINHAEPDDFASLTITSSAPVDGVSATAPLTFPAIPATVTGYDDGSDITWFSGCDDQQPSDPELGTWYRYTATASQLLDVDTQSAENDANVIVYNTDGTKPTSAIACDGSTSSSEPSTSRTTFSAVAGKTYLFQVGSNWPYAGNFTLTITPAGTLVTGTPTITGTATAGSTLTVNPGVWAPQPVTLTYQWNRNAVPISGATKATYVPVSADGGTTITVTVTGKRTEYAPASRTSSGKTVGQPLLTLMPTPTISGATTVGSTLTANSGTWDSGVTLSYQWKKNGGTYISGATSKTYVLKASDAGATLTVSVTGTKSGYSPATKTSATTAAITNGAVITGPTPTITGTAAVGQKLTAVPGTWTPAPVTLAYQWKRGGAAISGATASTYSLVAADSGAAITVTVTGTKTGYTAVTKTSAAVTVSPALQTLMPTPTITGTTTAGGTLTANPGTWDAGTTLAYQWKKNGGTYISGATSKTYVLKGADAGATITVSVTSTKPGYSPATKTSATTAKIANGTLTGANPTIAGTAKVGQILTAKPGTWGPSPVTLNYQWFRGTTAISGATAATYKLVTADKGKTITVKVTGTKTGYTGLTKQSPSVKPG